MESSSEKNCNKVIGHLQEIKEMADKEIKSRVGVVDTTDPDAEENLGELFMWTTIGKRVIALLDSAKQIKKLL